MKKFTRFSKRLLNNQRGQGMVEYILLLVVLVALITAFKEPLKTAVMGKVNALTAAIAEIQN